MNRRSYTIDDVKHAVSVSINMKETILALGMSPVNGTYVRVRKVIAEENIDTSHWGHRTNLHEVRKNNKPKPIEEYLQQGYSTKSSRLKARCIAEGLLDNVCYECGLCPEWEGNPLVLHLDHINGDKYDNRLENLRILCPNCHGQTDTWGTNNSTRYSKGKK